MGYGRRKWHSFFSTIGRHLECAIQTELVVLKIEKPRVKSFSANVHLRQFLFKTVKVIERYRDVTPRSKVKNGPKVPLCPKVIWCNSDHYFRSYGILKKMARAIFL